MSAAGRDDFPDVCSEAHLETHSPVRQGHITRTGPACAGGI